MAHPRRFRFGVQAKTATSGEDWAAMARKVEDLGYSTLFVPDHFGDELAPVPALMAAADATTELRVGALVFDNDYRHPVVLAKEAATIDLLSGGRLELGLGAGWLTTDYEQSGIPLDPPGVRVDRMVEGLAVIKGMFAEGPFSFAGEHYTIDGLDGLPKPLTQPRPAHPDRRWRQARAVVRGPRGRHRRASTRTCARGWSGPTRPPMPWPARWTARWLGCARRPATGSTTSS